MGPRTLNRKQRLKLPGDVHHNDHYDDFHPDAGGVGVDIDGDDDDLLVSHQYHLRLQCHFRPHRTNPAVPRTYQPAS